MAGADAADRRTRLFTVRIWTERRAEGIERRGSVRDVATGAFRSFRHWSDLTAFLAEHTDQPDQPRPLETKT